MSPLVLNLLFVNKIELPPDYLNSSPLFLIILIRQRDMYFHHLFLREEPSRFKILIFFVLISFAYGFTLPYTRNSLKYLLSDRILA